MVLGDEHDAASPEQIVAVLENEACSSVVANLLSTPLDERPQRFMGLMAKLIDLRMRVGRPHWIVIDEAHHMLPHGEALELPNPIRHPPSGLVLITVHPERLSRVMLEQIGVVIALGSQPLSVLQDFARSVSLPIPTALQSELGAGEALCWMREHPGEVVRFRSREPRSERHRHRRKYAAGALGEDKSFCFRGPTLALNLRAQNLAMFLQIADGVDAETFVFHLRQHDYSAWIRSAIKNEELADEVSAVEQQFEGDPDEARRQLRQVIERAYTLPA